MNQRRREKREEEKGERTRDDHQQKERGRQTQASKKKGFKLQKKLHPSFHFFNMKLTVNRRTCLMQKRHPSLDIL